MHKYRPFFLDTDRCIFELNKLSPNTDTRSGHLRREEALRDRLLPEGAVAAEEDTDRGRPVEGARPPAGGRRRGTSPGPTL